MLTAYFFTPLIYNYITSIPQATERYNPYAVGAAVGDARRGDYREERGVAHFVGVDAALKF